MRRHLDRPAALGAAARSRCSCHVEQVDPFVLAQPQRLGDGLQDLLGHAADVALLQPGVPFGAHSGQDGDLLAPQAGDPTSAAAGRQPDLLGREPRTAGGEEFADV
jgi:hypothetical protein